MKKNFTPIIAAIGILIFVAVAVPSINSNMQKERFTKLLEKAYGQFNQALDDLTDDYNCGNDLKCTNLFEENTTDKTFGDALVKYFNVEKDCDVTPGQGCFPAKTLEAYDGSTKKYYELDNWEGYRFITKDKMAFYVWNYASDCDENYSTGATGNLLQSCGEIYVDVNGPKEGPNTMGRDTFNLWISNGKGALLYPMGGADTNWSSVDWRWKKEEFGGAVQHCYPEEKTGWPCAGRIMEENWEMNY